MQATLTAFVVGGGAQQCARLEEDATCPRTSCWEASSRSDWRERLGQLIDAVDRSVEELGPEPPARWRRGQPMQLTVATVAEHAAVQEDIASAATDAAGDKPAMVLAVVLAMVLAMVLAVTSQLSAVQSGARHTCRLR